MPYRTGSMPSGTEFVGSVFPAGPLIAYGDRHLLDMVEQSEARGVMMSAIGRRPRLVLFSSKSVPAMPGHSQGDFQIYASYRGSPSAGFYGTLKVVRKTDGRLLYPFDGASDIGPFSTSTGALAAAQQRGLAIVDGDLAQPEL